MVRLVQQALEHRSGLRTVVNVIPKGYNAVGDFVLLWACVWHGKSLF